MHCFVGIQNIITVRGLCTRLDDLRVDKCSHQTNQSFHAINLSSKLRKFIICCDTFQRVKHPNRAYMTAERNYLPSQPGWLCAVDVYGHLSKAGHGVKCILVCYCVFCKYVKLYPLKAVTTRSCPNKITIWFSLSRGKLSWRTTGPNFNLHLGFRCASSPLCFFIQW